MKKVCRTEISVVGWFGSVLGCSASRDGPLWEYLKIVQKRSERDNIAYELLA